MNRLWEDLYAHRLDWAEEAYISFLREIFPDKVEEFHNHSEVSVAVYGSTQVGKTTLILKLIGINGDSIKTVSCILRGGRKEGKSSTATVVQYSRSPDDNWYFDHQQFSANVIRDKFKNLRLDVENGTYKTDALVNLKIPMQYFIAKKSLINVKILDLPGTHATNNYEIDHVNTLVQRYIPYADLILLVGKADDLGFLTPEKLLLEDLRSWHLKKNSRYRVVLTHTMEPETMMDWLKEQENLSKESLKKRFEGQLKTHNYDKFSSDTLKYIYPLENSDSWEILENSNPSIYPKVKPIMDEIFNDLITDISSSVTEHGRIKRAFVFHHDVKNDRCEILKREKNHRKKAKYDKQKIIHKIKHIDSYIDRQNEVINRYQEYMSTLCISCNDLKFLSVDEEIDKSVKSLIAWMRRIQNQVIHDYQSHVSNLYNRQYDISREKKEIEKKFDPIMRRLEKYRIDAYYFTDNFNQDRMMIEEVQDEAIRFAEEKYYEHINVLKEENQQKINDLSMKIKKFKIRQQQYKKDLDLKESELNKSLVDWEKKKVEYKKRYELSKKFSSRLSSAFSQEIKRVYSDIENTIDLADVFFKLCYIQLLYREFDTLTHGE